MFVTNLTSLIPRIRINPSKPKINNFVFKLHYRVTVTLLMAFVFLVCAREYFGEHIKCLSDGNGSKMDPVVQTYCFMTSTFTIMKYYDDKLLEEGVIPHPGVGPMPKKGDSILWHKYYQWVPFVLFLQSICFYLPHYFWKTKEGGRIKALVDGLQCADLATTEETKLKKIVVPSKANLEKRVGIIKRDFMLRLRVSRTWSLWLVGMEVMNLLNVMLQIWITNEFLRGEFLRLGINVIEYKYWKEIINPVEVLFPKVTKCVFHKFGASGTIQEHDTICLMSLNILYEKIYIGLWFWFLFLFIASVLAVFWRIVTFLCRRSLKFNQMIFRQLFNTNLSPHEVRQVLAVCRFSDWLFLYYLAKNLKSRVFKQLFQSLGEELEKKSLYPTLASKKMTLQ